MASDPDAAADLTIEVLLWTGSVHEMVTRLCRVPVAARPWLESAVQRRRASAERTGRDAELQLLGVVERRIEERFAGVDLPDRVAGGDLEITALLHAAAAKTTALGIYAVLRRRKALLSPALAHEISGQLGLWHPDWEESERNLKLLSVCAVLTRQQSLVVEGRLYLSRYCRLHNRAFESVRYLARARSTAERSDDDEVKRDIEETWSTTLSALDVADDRQSTRRAVNAARSIDGELQTMEMGLGRVPQFLRKPPDTLNLLAGLIQRAKRFPLCDTRPIQMRAHLRAGDVLAQDDRFEEAHRAYESAAELAVSRGDFTTEFEAVSLSARLMTLRGNYPRALRRHRQLIHRLVIEGDLLSAASVRNGLGTLLRQMGRPEGALAQFEQALPVKRAAGSPRGLATTYEGMANALDSLERPDEAMKMSMAALNVLTQVQPPDFVSLGLFAANILDRDGNDEVVGILEWLTPMLQFAGLHDVLLRLKLALARYHARRADRETADALYRECVSIAAQLRATSTPALVAKSEYARFLAARPDRAVESHRLLTEVIAVVESRVSSTWLHGRRSETVSTWMHVYESLIAELLATGDRPPLMPPLSLVDGDPSVAAFNLHEAAKSRTFLAQLADADLDVPPSVPQELQQDEARLLAARRALQRPDAEPEGDELARLGEINDRLHTVHQAMAVHAPHYVALRSAEPLTLADVRNEVFGDTGTTVAIVSFFCTASETQSYVIRSDRPGVKVFRAPIGQSVLKRVAARLRREFNGEGRGLWAYPPIRRTRPGERDLTFFSELSTTLLPFWSEIEGADLLVVAPHGPLHVLPLHAQKAPDGKYLIEHMGVVYVPSLSAFRYFQPDSEPDLDQQTRRSVYVAGVASRTDSSPAFFECDDALFEGGHWTRTVRAGAEAASRDRLLEEIAGHDVVHLTCHGFFDALDPMNSGLLFSDGRQRPPRAVSYVERSRYVVSARDLLRARMRASLVALRACSTGLQEARNAGDEFEGLTRSLLVAGSNAVIVSLWNVDQESSAQLLQEFYRRWSSADAPQEKWSALRKAQCAFLEADPEYLRHPYHWAPFVLVGDWR